MGKGSSTARRDVLAILPGSSGAIGRSQVGRLAAGQAASGCPQLSGVIDTVEPLAITRSECPPTVIVTAYPPVVSRRLLTRALGAPSDGAIRVRKRTEVSVRIAWTT